MLGHAIWKCARKTNIRIGKHIDVEIDADSKDAAATKIDKLCKSILSNPIIESFEFNIYEL